MYKFNKARIVNNIIFEVTFETVGEFIRPLKGS
jgi:hypothetical protein